MCRQEIWIGLGTAIIVIAAVILLICILFSFIIKWKTRKFIPGNHSKEQETAFNDEIFATGFAFDKRQNIFYSRKDAWQKKYGYRRLFDELASGFYMIMDCEPIIFEYEEEIWLIELWKGQYGITIGAEIGIYVSKDGNRFQCVNPDQELYTRFHLWKGQKLIAGREEKGWWITGFALGEYAPTKNICMTAEITLKDIEMRDAFLEALVKKGYHGSEITIWGNTVRIRYEKPYSKQPASSNGIFAKYVMLKNRINVWLFKRITRKQTATLDKIEYVKLVAPWLYRFMIKLLYSWEKWNERNPV